MVKHIILWTLNPELSEEEKKAVKAGIKAGLEGLVGKVPGLLDVKVHIDGRLASSNRWPMARFVPIPSSARASTLRCDASKYIEYGTRTSSSPRA